MKAISALYYSAAASTAIAGLIHLMLGPGNLSFNVNQGILFIVGGIAQVFWIVPMIRRWGKVWYAIGIAGTVVFAALFFVTRMPGNPITGRGGPVNSMGMLVEIFQLIFIGLATAILAHEVRKGRTAKTSDVPRQKSNRRTAILAGIAAALVVIGLFVLPLANSGPPRGALNAGGGPPSGSGGSTPPAAQLIDIIAAKSLWYAIGS